MKRTTLLLTLSFLYAISYAIDPGTANKKKTGTPFSAPIINYTDIVSDCSTGDRTLSDVQIFGFTAVPVAGPLVPRIYYRKSPSGTWVSRPGTLTTGTGLNGRWSFTIVMADIGGLITGDAVQYYVIAQSDEATPLLTSRPAGAVATNVNTVTTPPSTPATLMAGPTLNGNYNVGTGGDFLTLRAAINAYNSSCLTGPVLFNLTDATYTENTAITINAHAQASTTNTLTIHPANGVTTTITGNYTGL